MNKKQNTNLIHNPTLQQVNNQEGLISRITLLLEPMLQHKNHYKIRLLEEIHPDFFYVLIMLDEEDYEVLNNPDIKTTLHKLLNQAYYGTTFTSKPINLIIKSF